MHQRRYSGDIARLRSAERVERLEVKKVIRLCLEGDQLSNVLDVGTGSGLFAEGFNEHGLKVTGMDANPSMARIALSYIPQGHFVQATAESVPFSDNAFELAFYGLVLHETDDAMKALLEAFRIASRRVCILEWPYHEQNFGPPLGARLRPGRLDELFHAAGFKRWNSIELTNTVLYRLEQTE
jgi:ubiquinone/menaquinone biosynthesis C-methylase UbiE